MDGNPIAADDLFGCDHRFLLNRLGSTTPLLPDPITPVGVEHRQQASKTRMEHIYLQLVDSFGASLMPSDQSAAWQATQQAVTNRTPIVCGAYLPSDPATDRAGAHCILMLAADGEHYTPIITVNHKTYDVRAAAPHAHPIFRWKTFPAPRLSPTRQTWTGGIRSPTRNYVSATTLATNSASPTCGC